MMEFSPSSIIARSEVVARIAERTCLPGEGVREARNKVGHRITYAVKTGELIESSPPGYFVFGTLAAWARNAWPGLLDDWPHIQSVTAMSSVRLSDFYDFVSLPGTLKSCHDAIIDMHEKIKALEQGLHDAKLEIERLRPSAEQWQLLCRKNQQNAGKPRK